MSGTRAPTSDGVRLTCGVVAGMAGLMAALAIPAHPSGVDVVNRLLVAGYVAVAALAGARARRWSWLILAGVAGTFAAVAWATVAGVTAVILAGIAAWRHRSVPLAGALVGALGALATLRLADGGVTGLSLLLGILAASPLLWSGYRQARRRTRRVIRISAAGSMLAVAVIGLFFGVAILSARTPADRGVQRMEAALAAARAGDVLKADQEVASAQRALDEASRSLGAWWVQPARAVPVLGHNARSVSSAIEVARDLTAATSQVIQVTGGDNLGMRDGRFDPAAFKAVRAPLVNLRSSVDRSDARLEMLNSPWLLDVVTDQLGAVRTELRRARGDVDLALEGVDVIPDLLGRGGERAYLVLFVTPVEARATGFAGNYGELVVKDGRFSLSRFGRIGQLKIPPDPRPALDLPQEFLDRYVRFGIRREFQSATTSPDFPSVARLVSQLYAEGGNRQVDGVLSVDPTALAAFLRFTGPISVPEVHAPLTADTAAGFLLRDQYVVLDDNPKRADALESISRTTFTRLTEGSLPPPQRLVSVLGPPATAGNLRFVAFDEKAAKFLARIGIDHPLPRPVSDGMAVTTTNVVGGKQDLFLQRTLDYDAAWDPATGAVSARLRVTMRNDAPSSGLPVYVIGDAIPNEEVPLGTNRSRVSIYSPWELVGATLDGRPLPVENTRERGYHVYGAAVELAPNGGTATIELRLSGSLAAGQDYDLAVWNQVLARPDKLHASVQVAGTGPLEASGLAAQGRRFTVDGLLQAPRRYRIHPLEMRRA